MWARELQPTKHRFHLRIIVSSLLRRGHVFTMRKHCFQFRSKMTCVDTRWHLLNNCEDQLFFFSGLSTEKYSCRKTGEIKAYLQQPRETGCPIRNITVFLSLKKAIYSICHLCVSIIFEATMETTNVDIILYFEHFISCPA